MALSRLGLMLTQLEELSTMLSTCFVNEMLRANGLGSSLGCISRDTSGYLGLI